MGKTRFTLFKRSCALLFLIFFNATLLSAQQDIYPNQLISSSSDIQNPQRLVDTNRGNYAHITNLLTLLSSSHVRVRYAQPQEAGDVINVTLRGTGQVLGTGLLSNVTIRLYNSAGTQVASATGNSLLQLSLLSPGTGIYGIRYFTNAADTFHFTEVRVEFNNVLTANVLNELRIYNVFIQEPCPPVYANGVYAFGTNSLLTGYVSNPSYAVNANPNDAALLAVPLSLLNLIPPAYLDLSFPLLGRAGDYVGFNIGQATSLLDLSVVQNITIQIYDQSNQLRETRSGFSLANLRLLAGTTDRYSLGFLSQSGNYRISRLRITLNSLVGLSYNMRVFNAYHYAANRPPVTVTVNGSTTICQGGSRTLTAVDSFGAANYLWNTGATTQSITVNQPGVYFVEVTDSLSCSRRSIPIEIIALPGITPVITGDTVLCDGSNGQLSTAGNYISYTWSSGGAGSTISNVVPGTYYVTVTDSNGCSGSDTVSVQNHNLNIMPAITNTTCSNGSNGSINLSVSGGGGNYTYQWQNGNTSNSISSLSRGLYTTVITDVAYGCSYNRAFTVVASNTLSVRGAVVNTSGCNLSDGRINTNIIGGSGNYTYSWSNGATTANLNNVSAGIYRVTITDNTSLCQVMDTFIIKDNASGLTITPAVTSSSCSAPNGAITLTVTGGSGNYSYLWSNNSTSSSLSNIPPGIYYVRVRDNTNNCSNAIAVTVLPSAILAVAGTVTPSVCNSNNGSIAAVVTGGSGSYTYSWSTGATTATINNLRPGTYILNVTNNTTGCTASKVYTVGEAGGPVATLTVTQPGCNTNILGSISVSATGNNSYLWSNGATTQNISNLLPGVYGLTVTNNTTGCSGVYSATLNVKDQILISASPSSNTACAAFANGSISTTVSGGLAPYSYMWSNNATTQNIQNLNSGNYTLSVNDAAGCANSVTVPIKTDSNKLLAVVVGTITNANCNTATNGSATIIVSNGVAPYTYQWSNGATTQNLINVLPGNYTVVVTDALGCSKQVNVTIGVTNNNPVIVTVDATTPAGCSGNTGAILISVSGGTMPYTYQWSNGSTAQDLTAVPAGSYTVTVLDASGCGTMQTATVPISGTSPVVLTLDSIRNASCAGSINGAVFVSIAGGQMPYTYNWSNGSISQDLLNVAPALYTLTATDANGCPAQLSATVGVSTTNQLAITVDSVKATGCVGGTNGAIYITASGGAMPYSYNWSNQATSSDITNLSPGSYSVTVTDAQGCNANASASVTINPAIVVHINSDSVSGAACNGSASGSVYVTVTQGVMPYTYMWSNGFAGQDLINVVPGNYMLSVTDASGCTATLNSNITIDPNKQIDITVDSVSGTACAIGSNGSINISVSGGLAPYMYMWSNGATAQDITGLSAGNYNVSVTDAYNCTMQEAVSVGVDTANGINIITDNIQGAGCAGNASGDVSVDISGGTLPYSFMWSNGSTAQNLNNVVPGSYTLNVSDAAGCTAQYNVNVGIDTANLLTASINDITDASCDGSMTGAIDVNVTGGISPYIYSWSNSATSQDISMVTPGSYLLNITDAIGCGTQLSANVGIDNSNPVVVILDSIVKVGCLDSTSGQVLISVTGGSSPYTYIWSEGSLTKDIMNLAVGSYNVLVTDNAGCSASLSANVTDASPLVIAGSVSDVKCHNDENAAIAVAISGGSGMYTYNWADNNNTTPTINNLKAGNYILNVTDQLTGCSAADSFELTNPDSLVVDFTIKNDSCTTGNDGTITLSVRGGEAPYVYAWSNGNTGSIIENLAAGAVSVKVTDNNQCEISQTIVVGFGDCNEDIVIHDVITPNNDGYNDVFTVEGIGLYAGNQFQVFDKWGDLVYDVWNYNNDWKGIDKKGNPLPDGTYFYVIKLNEKARVGSKNEFAGSLLIQR